MKHEEVKYLHLFPHSAPRFGTREKLTSDRMSEHSTRVKFNSYGLPTASEVMKATDYDSIFRSSDFVGVNADTIA